MTQISRIEVVFPMPVDLPEKWERRLDALVGEVCDAYEAAHPGRVMWPAGFGSAPQFSRADLAFLGKPDDPQAPASGEPTFDDSVFQIEVAEREAWPEEIERKKRRTPSPATDSALSPSPVADWVGLLRTFLSKPFTYHHKMTDVDIARADGWNNCRVRVLAEIDAIFAADEVLSSQAPKPASAGGEVVIITNESGTVCYAVTRQDDEGSILSVIWKAPPTESLDLDILFDQWWLANCKTRYRESVARAAFEAGYRVKAIAAEADTAKELPWNHPDWPEFVATMPGAPPDRLAPIEARGVVTESEVNNALDHFYLDGRWKNAIDGSAAHNYEKMLRALEAFLRARESAPAVEGTKMDFHIAFGLCEEGLIEWKSKDHNRRWWKKIDGTPIPNDLLVCIAQQFVEAAMPPPSVATGCAGEVTEEMVSNAMMAYQAAAGTDGPVFGDSSRCMRAALEYALSQPARAAGET